MCAQITTHQLLWLYYMAAGTLLNDLVAAANCRMVDRKGEEILRRELPQKREVTYAMHPVHCDDAVPELLFVLLLVLQCRVGSARNRSCRPCLSLQTSTIN